MLMGEVTGAPTAVKDDEGRPATTFDLVIERTFQTPEGVERSTRSIIPVLAVGKAAEAAQALRGEGDLALIEGRIFAESQKVDGRWHNRSEVVATRLEIVAGARRPDAPPAAVAGVGTGTAATASTPPPGAGLFDPRASTPPARRGRGGRSGTEATGPGRG